MGHTLMKRGMVEKVKYVSKYQKLAKLHSSNSILAKKGLRKIEKEILKSGIKKVPKV